MTLTRRTYYDHEPVYQNIAANNGRGWDDRSSSKDQGSYGALTWFLDSPHCPKPSATLKALDLGCGGGQATFLLAERGFQVTGIDYSATAIALARQNAAELGHNMNFHVGDCLDLAGFPNGEFDLVIDNHVFHCLIEAEHRASFLRAACRVLKAGGVMFSETMSAEGAIDFDALGIDTATRIDRHRSRYWVKQGELTHEFESAGFRIAHQELRHQPELPASGDTVITVAHR